MPARSLIISFYRFNPIICSPNKVNLSEILIFRGSLFVGEEALNNIDRIYQAGGELDTALGYLEQSLKLFQQIGDIANELEF